MSAWNKRMVRVMDGSQILHVERRPEDVAMARRAVRRLVDESGYAPVADDAALCVSELVTNALLHGSGEIRVLVNVNSESLTVTVEDDGNGAPMPRKDIGAQEESGRGLALVAALADDWGHNDSPSDEEAGLQVWFRFDAVPAAAVKAATR